MMILVWLYIKGISLMREFNPQEKEELRELFSHKGDCGTMSCQCIIVKLGFICRNYTYKTLRDEQRLEFLKNTLTEEEIFEALL